MTIRLNLKHYFLIFGLAIATLSCKQEPKSGDVYEQIESGAAKNDKDRIYEIDISNSVISWTYDYETGQSISGKIHPTLGSLIIENEMITAGFVEADLLNSKVEPPINSSTFQILKKTLADSVPLLRTSGRIMRLDISLAERKISRSEFNVGSSIVDSLNSYLLGANLKLNDSTRIVSLPVSLQINPKQIDLTGTYQFTPGEFGVKRLGISKKIALFNPQVQVVYTLRFKPIG